MLLAFSSGLPFGLVWYAIPDWMRDVGVDIRLVGLFTLAQAPWAFKVVWAPLVDRFVPPLWGRRRGWIAVAQATLLGCSLLLASLGPRPDPIWTVGLLALAIALASATQDIAYDAYSVEVLRPEEQGAAVGARTALYRAAMAVSGAAAIALAGRWGWPAVHVLLALCYVPLLFLTWKIPEPEEHLKPPETLRAAIWEPFVGFLSRPRALEILAFVVLYKLADQLAQALTLPFLIDLGYSADQRGLAVATIGLGATMGGALAGGWITTLAGLGRSLWIFGVLQIFSNAGYYILARLGSPNLPLLYGAVGFELFTSGLGTGAFGVLLLRLTEKRFSAAQYALFSSLFALPRVLAGPVTGFAVYAMGWAAFYLTTMIAGIPGLLMLARFVPPGTRDPVFAVEPTSPARASVTATDLVRRGAIGAVVAGLCAVCVLAGVAMLRTPAGAPPQAIGLAAALRAALVPGDASGWLQLIALGVFAIGGGIFAAAIRVARRRGQ